MPWAYVENGKVKQTFDGTRGAVLNNVRHSVQIFGKSWTDAERAEIGLLPLVIDSTKPNSFQKPTGEYDFKLEGGIVHGKPVYRTPPIDQVKGRLVKDIAEYADSLKERYFSKEDRTMAALNLAVLEGEAHETLKKEVEPKIRYINAVNRTRQARLNHIELLSRLDEVTTYDWKDGWPLPEE